MVSYTHKRPLRGHYAPPLQKPGESLIYSARHLSASFSPCLRRQILRIAPLCVRFSSLTSRKICTHLTDFILSALPCQSVCAFGLTSWGFMVNYTHKRPLRGHCAPPLQKPGESLINSARHLSASFPLAPRRQILRIAPLCVRFVSLIERKICTHLTDFILSALPCQSVCAFGLTSWGFMVN